jgi:hypothetical protein
MNSEWRTERSQSKDATGISTENKSASILTGRIGFWSALLTALLAFGWDVSMAIQNVISPPRAWQGIEAYLRSYNPIEMLNLVPSLPLASVFIVLMIAIHFYAPVEKKIWSLLGVAFAIVYAVFASINYLIQFIVVRPAILSGEGDRVALLVMGNPDSVFWALANSYMYMSISLLFAAWVFEGGRLERWIRWIFIAVGITAPFQFAHSLFGISLLIGIPVILTWMVGVPISSFLLAILFRRFPSQSQQGETHYA